MLAINASRSRRTSSLVPEDEGTGDAKYSDEEDCGFFLGQGVIRRRMAMGSGGEVFRSRRSVGIRGGETVTARLIERGREWIMRAHETETANRIVDDDDVEVHAETGVGVVAESKVMWRWLG